MTPIIKISLYLFLCSFLIGCSKDDDLSNFIPKESNPPSDGPVSEMVTVRFVEDFSIKENEGTKQVKIYFDKPANTSGEFKIMIHLQEGLVLQISPEAIGDTLTLSVERGAESVSFNITPIDDNIIKGMMKLSAAIISVSEGFKKSSSEGITIRILDDELKGKPKKYIFNALTTEYFYRADGKISETTYTSSLVGGGAGTSVYNYSEDGNLIRIDDELMVTHWDYIWEDDKIIRSEEIVDGLKRSYNLYEYDEKGHISSKTQYFFEETSQSYKTSSREEYLFNKEGNLYKVYWFSWNDSDNEYKQYGDTTYEDYSEIINPFSLNEIIPGLRVQTNLYGTFKWRYGAPDEYEGVVHYTYTYDSEGKPVIGEANNGDDMKFEYY